MSRNGDGVAATPAWMGTVLRLAALYNLAWGIGVILLPHLPFDVAGVDRMNYPVVLQMSAMVIGVYGIGYWLAASDPVRHYPIVLVGMLGKIFGPIMFVIAVATGQLPLLFGLTILTNDVVWWVPLVRMLRHARAVEAGRAR